MASKANTKNKSGNPAKHSPVPAPSMTSEHQFQLARLKVRLMGSIGLGVILCLLVLSTWPVASQFAGEDTRLNFVVSLSFVGVAAAIGAVGAIWGNHHRQRANRMDERNKRLGRIVHVLRDRVSGLGGDPNVPEDVDSLTGK